LLDNKPEATSGVLDRYEQNYTQHCWILTLMIQIHVTHCEHNGASMSGNPSTQTTLTNI